MVYRFKKHECDKMTYTAQHPACGSVQVTEIIGPPETRNMSTRTSIGPKRQPYGMNLRR